MTDNRPISISLFTTHLHAGGAQRAMLTLAEGLDARGYNVDMVLVSAEGEFIDEAPEAVDIVDLDADRVLRGVIPLKKYLNEHDPDVLLSTVTVTNLVATWATLLSKSDTKVVLRESVVFSKHKASYPPLKRLLIPRLVRYTYRRADAIVGVTHETREDIADVTGLDPENLYTIYNNIDIDLIEEKAMEPSGHDWLDADDIPVFLGVGRLSEQKDFATLIRAFNQVRNEGQAKLVIIGEGPKRDSLEELIETLDLEDVVSLPGYKDNPYAFMGKADVVVLSSKWEGIANVLLEAMACGTDVVSTDCGTAEIINQIDAAKLVPVNDHQALANAMVEALQTPTESDELQSWVRENCSSMIEEYEEVIQTVVNEE